MVVTWTKNKYPGKSVIRLDLDELSECYDKTENVFDEWGDKKWHRVKLYTKAKLLRLFKHLKEYECDRTKEDILGGVKSEKLRSVWAEYYPG